MSKPKAFVELPCSLLPKIGWSEAPFRTPLAPLRLVTQSPRKGSRRASESIPTAQRSIHTTARRKSNVSVTSKRFALVTPGVGLPAIRHDGVYVAAFKTAKRAFHATAPQSKDHHFDTLKFVTRLRDDGISEEQAVAMMRVLNDVIEESIQNLTRTMVLKEGTMSSESPKIFTKIRQMPRGRRIPRK